MSAPDSADDSRPAGSLTLRAFAALEHVAAAGTPQSLDDVTLALGLPKPTVFRILQLLREAALLRRDGQSKRYTLGPRLTALALTLWRGDTLRAQWHTALQAAVAETGESCSLTLLEGRQLLVLDHAATSHPLRLHVEIGQRMPLHCTASGKLFLSAMSDEAARQLLGGEPYAALTRRTITDFTRLSAALAQTRSTHIGLDDGETLADTVALAVPVPAADGGIAAAVAVHAPASRASLQRCAEFVPALRRAAAQVAATMAPHRGDTLQAAGPARTGRQRRHDGDAPAGRADRR